jgi:catechol 2,3-dioxygenase-like lactoylglutathione lyase family enzyme
MTQKSLKFPNIGHIGVVVKDLEKVVKYYSSVFGIGPFDIYDFEPQKTWVRGKAVKPFKLRIATADLGSARLELLQVVEGNPPHREFLDVHGEGLQHIGFYVENYDEWKVYAAREGIEFLYEAEIEDPIRGKRRAFYMNSSEPGGVLFEIIERQKK